VAVGTFIEGEFTVLAACFAVSQETLTATPVMAAAYVGAFSGDWFFFRLGRRKGDAWLQDRPKLSRSVAAVSKLLVKYSWGAIFILRFQIGCRMAGNFALGSGGMKLSRYLVLNGLACLLWAVFIPKLCLFFWGLMIPMWERILAG